MVTADTNRFHLHEEVIEGVNVVEVPDLLWGRARSGWDAWNGVWKLWYLFRQKKRFDIVHLQETRPSTILPVLPFLKLRKLPLVIDWNDWWAGKGGIIAEIRPWWQRWTIGLIEAIFEERFRTLADGTTVISTPLRDRAIELGVPPDRVLVLRGGTNSARYPALPKERCREKLGLPVGDPLIGFSSLDSHLDLELVFQAFGIVRDRFPSSRIIITGQVNSRVQAAAREFGVSESIMWTGYVPQDEFMSYLGCCDVCLLPLIDKTYNRGRWPNKLLDYITVGRPVVANAVGDIADLIVEHGLGHVTDWEPSEFAGAILGILEDPILAEQMGKRGRELAEGELAWSSIASKLEGFYESTISGTRNAAPVGGG